MSFDARQAQRKKILDRIVLASQAVMVLYLAMHTLIAYAAFTIDGVVAAVLTFVLLGFGDLYWGLRWAYEGDAPWQATTALAAAAVCFTSWATRGMFNRWATSFTIDMLDDFSDEMKRMSKDLGEPEDADAERDRNDPPPSGGARV